MDKDSIKLLSWFFVASLITAIFTLYLHETTHWVLLSTFIFLAPPILFITPLIVYEVAMDFRVWILSYWERKRRIISSTAQMDAKNCSFLLGEGRMNSNNNWESSF